MKNKHKKIIIILLLTISITTGSLYIWQAVAAFEHGTTDKKIKENMLNNTPPADYKINQSMQGDAKDGVYNEYFLKDKLQTVSINIDENNLNYLLQNADQKPTVMTNSVTIGDKTIHYTGLKTKGSYTLEHAFLDNIGSDRFSFTINFGKYIKKKNGYDKRQNFYGCNKISFNNFFFDKSMMREYIAMKLMTEMGVPTPQYGLAKLYINKNYYGVYFMVEALDSSILEQYFETNGSDTSDYIIKPENTTLEYDNDMDKFIKEDGTFDLSTVLKKDADGNYTATGELNKHTYLWEEDTDTLQDIATMLPTALGWQKKLTQLSSGTDFNNNKIDVNSNEYLEMLGQVIDIDEALRYFATHSWLVQIDNMFVEQHNMGLYIDTNGKSLFLPWDYDLCFGCYYPSTAETTANMDIDLMYKDDQIAFENIYGSMDGQQDNQDNTDTAAPKNVPDYSSFPFFQVIYQNNSLMEKYHQYMKDCSIIATLGGKTSDDRSYNPGWFNSCISDIEEELIQAAGEKLADNVYYLNRTSQPHDIEFALPNLKNIIALRSLGVMLQADGTDILVSGYACNLETLGNAMQGMSSNTGRLAAIDAGTGIYSIAEYGDSWANEPPALNVEEIEDTNPLYTHVKESLDTSDAIIKIFSVINTGIPEGENTLYFPAGNNDKDNIPLVYACTDKDKPVKIEVKKENNTYAISPGDYNCFALVYNNLPEKEQEIIKTPDNQSLKWIMAAAFIAIIAITFLVIIKKQNNTKKY